MKSRCQNCANYNDCRVAAGIDGLYVIECPDYVKGETNPCESMKRLGDDTTMVLKEISKSKSKENQKDILSKVEEVLKELPPLFNNKDFKEACVLVVGGKLSLTREVKGKYLKSNGKGYYINKLSKHN